MGRARADYTTPCTVDRSCHGFAIMCITRCDRSMRGLSEISSVFPFAPLFFERSLSNGATVRPFTLSQRRGPGWNARGDGSSQIAAIEETQEQLVSGTEGHSVPRTQGDKESASTVDNQSNGSSFLQQERSMRAVQPVLPF